MAAGNAIIGALRVVLGADTAQFEDALKSASLKLGFFAGAAGAAGVAIANEFMAGIQKIAAAIPNAINEMDKFSKSSQKLGIPVDQLSALKYAADLADVSFEGLSKGVGKLSKAMTEAAAKPTSDAAYAFRALGVSVTDSTGNLKSSDQVLLAIAERFRGAEDGAAKTAVAMALFGKAGAELIPFLNMGRDGIKELTDEARRFGVVVGSETGKQAEEFNDNLKRLEAQTQGMVNRIAGGLLPTLVNLSKMWVENRATVFALDGVLRAVDITIKSLVTGAVVVSAVFKALGNVMTGIIGSLGELVKGNISKAFEKAQQATANVTANFTNTKDTLKEVWGLTDQVFSTWAGEGGSGVVKTQEKINYAILGGKNALQSYIDGLQKSRAAQEAELQTEGLAAGAKERLAVILKGQAIAKESLIKMSPQMQAALNAEANATGFLALQMNALRFVAENNPLVLIGQTIDALNLKLAEGNLSATEYARVQDLTARLAAKSWEMASESFGQSVESMGSSLSQMSNNWARLAKIGQAIGASIAFINAYIAASDAFAKAGFPQNIAIAAGVLAKGIAMVAAIKGAAVPSGGGFATGGMVRVPGGMGGSDKVRAMVDLNPGEQLDIWRPDQGGTDPRRGGAGQIVQVHVPQPGRDYIGAMIDSINGAIKDGYRLELAPV